MSNGASRERLSSSERWSARTGTVNRSASVTPEISMPFAFMYSTCSGHGSRKVTSCPVRARCPPV